MIKFFLMALAAVGVGNLFAQNTDPPLEYREVSGVIMDRQKEPVIGAMITLATSVDTVKTVTNDDGIFAFKKVKSSVFYVNVHSLSHVPVTYHFFKSDMDYHIVLDPIILDEATKILDDVEISALKGVTYKTDTIEYVATDYIIRADARVEDLIKKMEGIEVGRDGSVSHQGEKVSRAQLNGKDFAGGGVSKTIKTLPAEIVDKVQVIDDYGEQAARTGIKDDDPEKVLNITTKDDRSVGKIFRFYGAGGGEKRYEGRANLVWLDANQVITADGWIRNTVNGVAGDDNGLSGGIESNGGTTNRGAPSISYRNDLGKKVEINANYSYNYENVDATNSFSQRLFGAEGVAYLNNESVIKAFKKNHSFNVELDYDVNSNNFLQVSTKINYADSKNNNSAALVQSGVIEQDYNISKIENYVQPVIEGNLFYQHLFKKERRNISLNLRALTNGYNSELDQTSKQHFTGEREEIYKRYFDMRNNDHKTFQGTFTMVEPFTSKSQLEFKGEMDYKVYDNEKKMQEANKDGNLELTSSLSNIFNYSFLKTPLGLNYRYGLDDSKLSYSIGLVVLPSKLQTFNGNSKESSRKTDLDIAPIFRMQYAWSQSRRFSLNYSSDLYEPSVQQFQPVRDILDPQNHIIGNQNLNPFFKHELIAKYNHYIPNSRINLSTSITGSLIEDKIVANRILNNSSEYGLIYETRFLNVDGIYGLSANYNIQKRFVKQRFTLALNGTASYNHHKVASDNTPYIVKSWRISNRLGPKFIPFEWLEIDLNLLHDRTISNYSLNGLDGISVDIFGFDLNGEMDFMKICSFKGEARKQYIRGISSASNNNPFVVDLEFEMRLFKKRNGALRLQVFDLFNQNNFINRTITETGVMDMQTNLNSRYFMMGFRTELQKWKESPKNNGKPLKRRGDGSFTK